MRRHSFDTLVDYGYLVCLGVYLCSCSHQHSEPVCSAGLHVMVCPRNFKYKQCLVEEAGILTAPRQIVPLIRPRKRRIIHIQKRQRLQSTHGAISYHPSDILPTHKQHITYPASYSAPLHTAQPQQPQVPVALPLLLGHLAAQPRPSCRRK